MFLNIRGKSVGEEIEVNVLCPDDEQTYVPVKINIDEIQVKKNSDHSKNIKIDDKVAMEMGYPSLDQFIKNNFDFSDTVGIEQSFELIATCIEQIFTEEESWVVRDVPKKEVMNFLEQMNSSQFKQIEKFFETMPKLSHEVPVKNPSTGVKSTVLLEGLSSFSDALSHMDLENYYKLNFALLQYHKYSLTEVENLIPWEREVYVELLKYSLRRREVKSSIKQDLTANGK